MFPEKQWPGLFVARFFRKLDSSKYMFGETFRKQASVCKAVREEVLLFLGKWPCRGGDAEAASSFRGVLFWTRGSLDQPIDTRHGPHQKTHSRFEYLERRHKSYIIMG